MRIRLLLCLLLFVGLSTPLRVHAAQTAAEAAAITAAQQDHTAYTLPPDKLAKSEALYHTRMVADVTGTLWSIGSLLLILHFGIAARMRNVAVNLFRNRWAQGLVFFFEFLLLTSFLMLPFPIYDHHEEVAYGLSVQHWGSWLADQAKSFALTLLFGWLGLMLLFYLIRKFPRRWWLVLWFPTVAFSVMAVFVTPYVIDPLFNKFEPLAQSNPQLVDRLERVVARGKGIDIPRSRMFLMKASDKVTTLNAYVTGFGASKRVVVWDTSIAKGTPDEILFIFGHEMGHYVLGHILTSLLFGFVLMLVFFFFGFLLLQFLLSRFGPRWRITSQNDWAAFVVFVLVLSVLSFLGEPLGNAFSRAHEHEADVYGQEVVHGIVSDPQWTGQAAFQLLGENGLSYPYTPWLANFWLADHPAIAFRAGFAKHYDPWRPSFRPKYFAAQ